MVHGSRAEQSAEVDADAIIEQLVGAQELERERLAGLIHDDPVQALVAVRLRIQLLAGRLAGSERAIIDSLNDAVSLGMEALRRMEFELHPRALRHALLGPALQAYLDQLADDIGIDATLDYRVESEPPQRVMLTVFRIVQEAIDYLLRRADAAQVEVRVLGSDGGLLTEVRHKGDGAQRSDHGEPANGRLAMAERAHAVGGWWQVDKGAAGDTSVRFWVPLSVHSGARGSPS